MRFSLRTGLVVFLVVAAVLAWKQNQLYQKTALAKEMRSFGVETFLHWQKPTPTPFTTMFDSASMSVPVSRSRPDGSTYIEQVLQPPWGRPIQACELRITNDKKPDGIFEKLWPDTQGLVVEGVSLNIEQASDYMIGKLAALEGLKVIVIRFPKRYHQVMNGSVKFRDEFAPMKEKMKTLKTKLPNVTFYEGIR